VSALAYGWHVALDELLANGFLLGAVFFGGSGFVGGLGDHRVIAEWEAQNGPVFRSAKRERPSRLRLYVDRSRSATG
jgi:hypothetical protein